MLTREPCVDSLLHRVSHVVTGCEWKKAASWAPLAEILDSPTALTLKSCMAVLEAKQALNEKRRDCYMTVAWLSHGCHVSATSLLRHCCVIATRLLRDCYVIAT